MATTFDITGRINAVVSSGSLRMLKKLQTELRATAKTLLQMGETTAASALGHTAMALDKVAAGAGKAAKEATKLADSTKKTTAQAAGAAKAAERQSKIYGQVAEGYKLNAVEAGALYKAVGRLGQKYSYAANMQKEWVPTLKSSLSEIYKQKAALVASGRAITTHVSSQELFDRVNRKLSSGLHTISGKLTDYDSAMGKSLGRSSAFRKEVDKIAGAVGKQGESFKSQFAALTKSDDLWRKHVTTLHRSGEITTKVAKQMYAASEHFNMPLEKLRANIKSTVPQVSLFSRAMSSLVAHLKSFAAYAAAASIITGVAAMFGLATRAIIKYDQALHDLQAITRATNDEVALMGEKIREIGRTTKFSASEVAVAMRTLGQAGFTAQEAIASIGAVADLATGTLTSMKTVVDLVTTAIRAFDLNAIETTRVADIFANAVNRSKLTIDKLRIAFNYIGPIAAKTGITLEETATSTMMLANAGIRASTIGTGLRRTFQQLIEPTRELKAAIEAAGYTTEDFNPQMNEMRDIIRRLAEIVPDAESAFRMFSLRSSAAVAALSSQGVASFDALHSAVLRSGTAAEMAEKQIEGLGIIFKQAWDKAQDLALAFGEAGVAGALRVLGKGFQMVFDGLRFFVSSGIGKAIIAVASLTASLYVLLKVLALVRKSVMATAFMTFAVNVWSAVAAGEALAATLMVLQTKFVLLVAAVGVLYGTYKAFTFFLSTEVKKVNTEYIDALDEIHKKELEQLEGIKRLVSTVRDELETNRRRANALIELSKRTTGFNLIIEKETGVVEDLTGSILKHKDALDEASASFGKYNEQAKLEKLVAQTKLFEDAGDAIEALAPKMVRLKAQAGDLGEQIEKTGKQGIKSFLGWNFGILFAAKQLKTMQKGAEALEAQQAEAHERRVKAVISFGEITQGVWRTYMLGAGAAAEEVAELFTDSEERITAAHVGAYLKIQLARESMTASEREDLENHIESIMALFDKVNNITARRLERDLREIRENYSEREKIATEFYSSDLLYMRKKTGFEEGAYKKVLGLVRRHFTKRLALLDKSYEEEKALIESNISDMADMQERITELKKKHANRRLKIEQEAAASIVVLAEEQLEVLAETYERVAVAYDKSVDRRIGSIDRCYDYEKTKLELQSVAARDALSGASQYAERWVAVEANTSLRRIGIENAYVLKKKDAATSLRRFERRLAEEAVALESQYFDELMALNEQAKDDRLANEAVYHKEQLKLIESAQENAALQYEEGDEERVEKEEELNEKLIEIDRESAERRIDILTNWADYLTTKYDDAVGGAQRYANRIIEIENEILQIRKKSAKGIVSAIASTEDQILSIRRAGMSEEGVLRSKAVEAGRKLAIADMLVSKIGTEEALKRAKKLYGEAQRTFTGIGVQAAKAAKEGERIGFTHKTAEMLVRRAGKGIINVFKAEKEASIAARQAELSAAKQAQRSWVELAVDIKERIGDIRGDISELTSSVGGLVSEIDLLEDKEVSIGADEVKLNTSIRLVKGLWTNINTLKDKTITITTKYVEERQAGGAVGLKYARGGRLPGFGGGDRISALLEAGEFIINKKAVRRYGAAMFDAYNSMAAPVVSAMAQPLKFAFGGFVGMGSGIAMKKRPDFVGSQVGGFSQIDKTIDGLSNAIRALNVVSSSLAAEKESDRRGPNESVSEYMSRKYEAGEQEKIDPEKYKISLPPAFGGLVKELGEDLKRVKGVDKTIVEEVLALLTPAGIKSEDIVDRIGGRKLPKVRDVEDVSLKLKEKAADFVQRKEELEKYLEDLKKVREFMQVVFGMLGEADSFTVSSDPYGAGNLPYKGNIPEVVTHMKANFAKAKPSLAMSGLDLSGIESAFTDYLDKQQLLGTFQQGNQGGVGIYLSSGKFHYTQGPTRFGGGGAGSAELLQLAEAQLARDLFTKHVAEAKPKINDEKKETLRDQVNKFQTQSDLVSEVKSAKQELTYEPMVLPNSEQVLKAFMRVLLGQKLGVGSYSLSKLKARYLILAKNFFHNLPKFAAGGFVDNILARLSPGEFVLRADVVRQAGLPFLNALNNFQFPVPAYAQGGLVEHMPVANQQSTQSNLGSPSPTVVINGDFYVHAAADDPSAVRAIDEKLAELIRSGRSRFSQSLI